MRAPRYLATPPRSGSNKYIMEHFACLSATDGVRGFCSDQQRDDMSTCFSNVTYNVSTWRTILFERFSFLFSINKFSYNLIFSEFAGCPPS